MSQSFFNWKSSFTLLLAAALFLSACGSSGAKNVTVNVTLTEFAISSSMNTFSQGVVYHFVVTNKGTVNHEFRIMPPTTPDLTDQQIQDATLASLNANELTPGATKSFDYTFTKAYPAGTLEFSCHLPSHYDSGMHLPIVVN